MTEQDEELERLLDGVWDRRRAELLTRVQQLAGHLDAALHDDAAWTELGAEAHRLTGALGSLAFDGLARDAHALEVVVAEGPAAQADRAALRTVVRRLEEGLLAATARPRR